MTAHNDKHFHALIDEDDGDSRLLAETLKALTQQIARTVDCSECCIYEYLPERRALRAQAIWSHELTDRDRAWVGRLHDLAMIPDFAQVVTRRTVLAAYAEDEDVTGVVGPESMAYWGELAVIWAPIVANDEVLGVLELTEKRAPRRFGDADKLLVRQTADLAALALRNAQLYSQLQEQKKTIERQATTDGLTGLYNHRHFFERLRAEAVRARRYGFALSLIMLDLDDFKRVNDLHGHPAGDRVLSTVGDILRAQVREDVDVPARYGGEEFAVILPHTGPLSADLAETANGAQALAERIRRAVAEVELPLPVTIDGLPAHITASIGVATLPAHAVDADDLVNRADRALYEAKQRGKDRSEVYVPS